MEALKKVYRDDGFLSLRNSVGKLIRTSRQAEGSDVQFADIIIEEDALNTVEGMPDSDVQFVDIIVEEDALNILEVVHEGTDHPPRSKWELLISIFFRDARHVFIMDELGREILGLAFPAVLTLAINPITSLIHTAFIRRLGQAEVAIVGVSTVGINMIVNIITFVLGSITASFVTKEKTLGKAEGESRSSTIQMKENDGGLNTSLEIHGQDSPHRTSGSRELATVEVSIPLFNQTIGLPVVSITAVEEENARKDDEVVPVEDFTASTCSKEMQRIPSATTGLVVAGILGVLLTLFLSFGAGTFLAFMGFTYGSPRQLFARRYLRLRSIGVPAVLLSSTMEGVFRGFKDTKTPLYATVAGELAYVALNPTLIFACHLGISGDAIAYVLSRYVIFFILSWRLMHRVDLLSPSLKDTRFHQFLKNGLLMLVRGIALTSPPFVATLLAAQLGSTPWVAFRICLRFWLASSPIAGGLAIAAQAILADSFREKKDYDKATTAASRVSQVSQMGFVLGLGITVIAGVGLRFLSGVFSRDVHVQHFIFVGIPFVVAAQPIISLSYVFDGVNFGASDFAYCTYSMVLVSIICAAPLFILFENDSFVGIWVVLIIHRVLWTIAGIWRMGTGTGPWRFLRERLLPWLL